MQKAYKRLALQCHPDKVGSDRELIDRFQAITTAYQVLSDPVATKAYWDMFRIRCFLFQTAHTPNAPLMPFYVFHVKKRDERGKGPHGRGAVQAAQHADGRGGLRARRDIPLTRS